LQDAFRIASIFIEAAFQQKGSEFKRLQNTHIKRQWEQN